MSSWELAGNIMGPPGAPGAEGPSGDTSGLIIGEIPLGSINGSNTSFSSASPFLANSLEVYLNGLRQRRVADYNEITATQFTFVAAPHATDSISIDYIISSAVSFVYGEIPAGALNGINKGFTTTYIFVPSKLAVFLSGMRLRRTDDYSETGSNSFQLVAAPLSNDSLSVDYIRN